MTHPAVEAGWGTLNWAHGLERIAFGPYSPHAPEGAAGVLVAGYRGQDGTAEPHPALALVDGLDDVTSVVILALVGAALEGPTEDYERRELPGGHVGCWVVPSPRWRSRKDPVS